MGSWWVGRRTLCAEELARDVELLAADNNNLLAVQKLLGDSGGQAAEKVALAVDDNLCISISHRCSAPYPPYFLQVVRVRAIAIRYSGMRTTGSKVDILLRLVRVVMGWCREVVDRQYQAHPNSRAVRRSGFLAWQPRKLSA